MTGRPDYDVGDLVVCVYVGPSPKSETPKELRQGAIYRVERLIYEPVQNLLVEDWTVLLIGAHNPHSRYGYYCSRFRKIDAADETFARQMRAIKPVREGVPA
jgi:hypothetical protein